MLKSRLSPLFCIGLAAAPLWANPTQCVTLAERMATDNPSPVVREVNKTVLLHLENLLEADLDLLPTYQATLRRMLPKVMQSGDIAFAQFIIFRLACVEAQTKAVNSAFFAELASHAPISPFLTAFWADALLATDENPHLVLALLNTYGDATTPNRAIFRAKALMRLGRKLDALHAIAEVFTPECAQSLPDPVLFALVGDICYANKLHREAALFWQRAIRAYERYQNDPDLDMPIEDTCLLFNYSIETTRKKYRAIRTLLKTEPTAEPKK